MWLAGWIVPRNKRSEWRGNRSRQVWHWVHFLAESGQLTRDNKIALARYCWGSFPEAWWQRVDREDFLRRISRMRGAPATCLVALVGALLLALVASGSVFSLRSFFSTPIVHPDQLCIVSMDGKGMNGRFRRVRSETLLDLTSIWQQSRHLSTLSPYSWAPGQLNGSDRTVSILTAQVGPDFFDVLGVTAAVGRTFQASDREDCRNCVVLSHQAWQDQFDGEAGVVGQHISIDGSEAKVIGILPQNFRLFSSGIAVWRLMDTNTPGFSNFVRRVGAIARLQSDSSPGKVQAELTDLSEDAGYRFPDSELQVISVQKQWRDGLRAYALFVLLVVSCAIAVVYARGGSSSLGQVPPSARKRFRWWGFFAAKCASLLGIMYLAASALARMVAVYLMGSMYPLADEATVWLFLILAIVALSWAIHDQQRRCRICLRRLGMSVDIGRSGSVLLNWAGTELVCPDGHGVLYLPESQANWLERDRWNTFDESWDGLFRAD